MRNKLLVLGVGLLGFLLIGSSTAQTDSADRLIMAMCMNIEAAAIARHLADCFYDAIAILFPFAIGRIVQCRAPHRTLRFCSPPQCRAPQLLVGG